MLNKSSERFSPPAASVNSGVKQSVGWIDKLAWIALVYLFSASLARVLGNSELEIIGITIPVALATVGVMVLTVAHLFIAKHIIRSCADAWLNLSREDRLALYDDVVRTGGILTKGANGYRDSIKEHRHSIELQTNLSDPPTVVHFVLVTLVFTSIVEMEYSLLALSQVCIAYVFVSLNWKIGESWVVCIGDLGTYNNKSLYFFDGTARPRFIAKGSGVINITEHHNYGTFLFMNLWRQAATALFFWIILLVPFFIIYGFVVVFKSYVFLRF